MRKADHSIVSKLHAEGRHIEAEWERLRINSAGKDATEEDLVAHRLSFFLGAVSVWQAIQDAVEDESVVDDLQAEMETFLEDMEAQGNITLTDQPADRIQ